MDRYYTTVLTVPSGTLSTAPLTQSLALEDAILLDVEITIPNGHNGFTGVRVRQSQQQILPWGADTWLIADGYTRTFLIDDEIGARSISMQGYNTDLFDHSFYLRFHLRSIRTQQLTSGSEAAAPLIDALTNGSL